MYREQGHMRFSILHQEIWVANVKKYFFMGHTVDKAKLNKFTSKVKKYMQRISYEDKKYT